MAVRVIDVATTAEASPRVEGTELRDGCERDPRADKADDIASDAIPFLEQAFARLGHVTVFSFADGGFMLLTPDGERVHGDSLVAAVRAMIQPVDPCVQRLFYGRTSHVERSA